MRLPNFSFIEPPIVGNQIAGCKMIYYNFLIHRACIIKSDVNIVQKNKIKFSSKQKTSLNDGEFESDSLFKYPKNLVQ